MLEDCWILNPSDIWNAFSTPHFEEQQCLKAETQWQILKTSRALQGLHTLFSKGMGILNKNQTKLQAGFLNHQKLVGFYPEVFPPLTSLQNKATKQLNQSKQAKNTLIQWLRFQKAHCEPEKQFCIKFVSNNRIKGILLVQKRLSILMYHELFLNSAYKTCLVGKTCHLLYSSKSITAANKECLYFTRPKRFLCKFLESRWSAA